MTSSPDTNLDAVFNPIITKPVSAGQLAGVSAVALTANGAVWSGAAGNVRADAQEMMSTDTVVWLASMTKAVTGAAVMQLVENKRIALDAPAHEAVEELRGVEVISGFSNEGTPQYRAPASPPTVRQLLTHTAGFGYDMWSDRLSRLSLYMQESGQPEPAVEPLLFDPGTDWAYGTGIDWAGRVVEAVSGMKLGEYLRANIFEPLAMHNTGFKITADMRKRLAPVHVRDENGSLMPIDFEIEQSPKHEMGGGGLYGTPLDYMQFCKALLGGGQLAGQRILSAATVEDMAQNHIGSIRVKDLATSAPGMTNDLAFFPGVEKTWGLTFMRNETATAHGRASGTLAWAGLANTYYWIDLAGGTAGVWATQLFPFNDDAAVANFYEFEAAVRSA